VTAATSRQDEERIWIEQARQGDHGAFARIVQAYQKPVYNLCYRMLGNQVEAEDAAQETFLRAYNNLHRYDPNRRFLNWILTIASNHAIDRLRRKRHVQVSLEDAPFAEQLRSHDEPLQARVERKEKADAIQHWIDQLSPNYRTPLVLLYWYDYSYGEIAETLKLSVPAVKSRLHRARKQVAELMLAEQAIRSTPTPASISV
jgi:RNA polymerase sigma-70 factor (ECF subfamily)